MSSGNLISSLFRDNSFASRSNSMFHKSFLGVENRQQRARSQSAYMDKSVNNGSSNLYLPVARMAHTLGVKVKKHSYFLFCRLQANLKKYRANTPSLEIQKKPVQIHQQSIETNISLSNNQNDKKQKISKGLQSISQFLQLKQLKLQNSLQIQHTFNDLKKYSKIKFSAQNIYLILKKRLNANISQSFKQVQNYEKFILKSQIFTQATVHVFHPKLRNVFKNIRDFAIENKIKIEVQERQKDKRKQQKFINLQGFYLGSMNERLKSIQQESSSLISEQETARFTTPEKSCPKGRLELQKLQKSKTSRKQSRNLVLMKKQTKKQFYQQIEIEQSLEISKSRDKKHNEQNQQLFRSNVKASTTKKQSHRHKISFGKAYKVQTLLVDKNPIKFTNLKINNQNQECMLKHNRLYSENIPQLLPDLHDNIGVFESLAQQTSSYYTEDCQMLSSRTVQKLKNSCPVMINHKTISHCKQKFHDDGFKQQQIQIYEARNTQNPSYMKQSSKIVSTVNSRTMASSFSSPKFCQAGINTSTQFDQTQNRQNHANNQFYSSPLQKIQEMIIDLQKLRQRQKFGKYTTGHQKCKIAVNLPKKSCQGRSYQNSATKISNHKTVIQQCRSQKKDLLARYPQKQNNNKQQKQNIQVKLWDEKQKFLFYAQKRHTKQRKNTNLISSLNQSQLNTARKMKKQIQNIIKSRKTRTSLGNLKLVRTKI